MFLTYFLGRKRSMITALTTTAALTGFICNASAQIKSETTLDFSTQKIFTNSAVKTFTIRGLYLAGNVTVSTHAPFLISRDSVTYQTSISYDTTELASTQTVYVKFKPTLIGNYADSVISISEGADSKIVMLTGKASVFNAGFHNNRLNANNVITPNGDGRNDTWIIKNIEQYPNNTVRLMNKSGSVVYSKRGYNNDWDGTYQNAPLPQGTYYYVVDFGEGQNMVFRGFITVVKD